MALMRITVDVTSWWNRRGFGRFTRGMVKALVGLGTGHRFVLLTDRPPDDALQSLSADILVVANCRSVSETAIADGHRRLGDVLALSRALVRSAPDVVFFPAVWSWFPLLRRLPSVVTLHDTIAERFPELIFPDRRSRLLWSVKVKLACWQARRYLTVSQVARRDLETVLALPAEQIDITTEAADPIFAPVSDPSAHHALRARLGIPRHAPVLLYVGGMAPHKNLARLIHAFDLACRGNGQGEARLVLTGDPKGDGFHSNTSELLDAVSARPDLAGRVLFTGFLQDEDLPTLYSTAAALALPSVAEGFGLPAVEAMACGTPVLCSAGTAVEEVAGDAAASFPHDDIGAMAQAIGRVVAEPEERSRLAARALVRAQSFSWPRAAELALMSLERAARKAR
jgi:glycosyltransferase involved in cell wall biosynthesis